MTATDAVLGYMLDLIRQSRQRSDMLPLSPRAARGLVRAAKAYAFLHSGNAVNHYLAAQLAEQTNPRAVHWLIALVLASLLVWLTQLALPLSSLSSAVLLILAITVLLAPAVSRVDKRRPFAVLLAMGYSIGLLALYMVGKTLVSQVMPTPSGINFAADWFTSAAFVALFLLAVLLRYHSNHSAVNKIFIWFNAGGYLDEWATRVTLKIWPYKGGQPQAGDKLSSLEDVK